MRSVDWLPGGAADLPDPTEVWAQASAAPLEPRPPAPVVDRATYHRLYDGDNPRWFVPFCLAVAGLFLGAVWAWSDVPGWLQRAAAIGAPALLALAVLGYVADPLLRPSLRRDAYAAYTERGILGHAVRTSFTLPGENSDKPVWLVIDHRVDDRQAARLRHAIAAWLPPSTIYRDTVDRKGLLRFHDLLETSTVLPLTRVFGPEADGGYLLVDKHTEPWRILVPHKLGWTVLTLDRAADA